MTSPVANARLYKTLIRVLDSIRDEAPVTDAIYHPPSGNNDALIQARSRALLHLFLKSKFGISSFDLREMLVTDGPHDGGVDAFYIDKKLKNIYFLQSKFRATAANFVSSNMSVDDLLKMQVGRILKGEKFDEDGQPYNDKIIKVLQKAVQKLPDVGSYTSRILLLGNSRKFTQANINKLVEGYLVEQFHHERIYEELLFPVVNGTYFSDPNLVVEISLDNLAQKSTHLDYDAKTASIKVNIKLIFAPTKEIGRVMSVYKNSILKYNPRSFLELVDNPVNKEIEQSIINRDNNEFSLFNNGITIVSDRTTISSDTAKQGMAQLILTNPQLVNGGQTAYVLGRIYEDCDSKKNFRILKGKGVLLRVITFNVVPDLKNQGTRIGLISAISKASNSQTKIEEADRRSGDDIQIRLQEQLFKECGVYYERKKGEFGNGIRDGYIDAAELIDRKIIVRLALALNYQSGSIRSGIAQYFNEGQLETLLKIKDAEKYAYGVEVLKCLELARKKKPVVKSDRYHSSQFGQALRHGINAVLAVCINRGIDKKVEASDIVNLVLNGWPLFESWAVVQPNNSTYVTGITFNTESYYRGATVDVDLKSNPEFKVI